jgi:hypothetical protein
MPQPVPINQTQPYRLAPSSVPALPAITSLQLESSNISSHQNKSSLPAMQQIAPQADNLIDRSVYHTDPVAPISEAPFYQNQQNSPSKSGHARMISRLIVLIDSILRIVEEGHQQLGLQVQQQQSQQQQQLEHMWTKDFMAEFLFNE